MGKIKGLLSFLFSNFGPIIVFYFSNHYYGLKIAIILSVVWTIAEVAFQRAKNRKTTTFFKFSAAITIAFGLVDMYLQRSFLFRYEAMATNILVGCYFASTLFSEKTLIQEFAEAQGRITKALTPDSIYYFQFLTVIWSLYFFVKAAFYGWVAMNYSIEEGLAIRGIIGNVSMYGLLFVSIFCARPIKMGLGKLRLLPSTRING